MPIELNDVKWGSDDEATHSGDHQRRRATEIVAATASCSECDTEWMTTPSHDDIAHPGTFLNGAGVIEITCPNGHPTTIPVGPLLPDPR